MKKIYLLTALLFLSACSVSNSKMLDENTATTNMYSTNNMTQAIDPIGADQNINKQSNNKQQTKQNNNTMNPRTTINENLELKDLATDYSQALIKTNQGDIKVKFYANESPLTVNNFMNLAEAGFYDGTRFHRVIADFMIQGGDPNSKDEDKMAIWGQGGPSYRFKDEINNKPLVKGSLAMANAGPATNGSQFFIVTADATPWLDGKHTNFGEVVEGMDVVEKIEAVETGTRDVPTEDMIVESVELLK